MKELAIVLTPIKIHQNRLLYYQQPELDLKKN